MFASIKKEENTTKLRRPGIITAICVVGFLGALVIIPLIFSDAAKGVGIWYPPYLAASSIIGLFCMIGLWNMKRWSIVVYAIFVAINQLVLLSMGVWNIFVVIVPGIVIAIGFSQYRLMEKGWLRRTTLS